MGGVCGAHHSRHAHRKRQDLGLRALSRAELLHNSTSPPRRWRPWAARRTRAVHGNRTRQRRVSTRPGAARGGRRTGGARGRGPFDPVSGSGAARRPGRPEAGVAGSVAVPSSCGGRGSPVQPPIRRGHRLGGGARRRVPFVPSPRLRSRPGAVRVDRPAPPPRPGAGPLSPSAILVCGGTPTGASTAWRADRCVCSTAQTPFVGALQRKCPMSWQMGCTTPAFCQVPPGNEAGDCSESTAGFPRSGS
ncbi:hypothetical protein JOF59_001244 [Streptomyces clavifer]|uniref:Uncharacterized protein n=1 Tax=Streptomyces clavifer TaxID=68188 RepID=A0ABS4V4K8_9ACTN|nr:hypothetical protein [Streptomyces clavifer]